MLRILTYHRVAEVADDSGLNPRLISATPDVFARQMHYLARRYRVVSMREVLQSVDTGNPLPSNTVLITFDDAYRDFMELAWPIMQAHRLPATLFVPTDYPDHPERAFWWDRLHGCLMNTGSASAEVPQLGRLDLQTGVARRTALVRLQSLFKSLQNDAALAMLDRLCEQLGEDRRPRSSVLGWDELRALAGEGVTLAAHTCSHPLLTRLSRAQIRSEVVRSQDVLCREIGDVLPVFSYPDGAHDDRVVETLRQEGFRVAVTQLDGHNDLRSVDPLRLHRTNMTRKTTPTILRLRLQTWFTHIDRWRHRERRPSNVA